MNDFALLRKNKLSIMEQLAKKVVPDKKKYDDDRFWTPNIDKNGNGYSIIRFLPPSRGSENPYIEVFKHTFKENGQWFVEECPTTIKKPCPICEMNRKLWRTNNEDNVVIARRRKRQTKYISNILVLSDEQRPENEGKVFLFTYGLKIFQKIINALSPEFEDEQAFNPFDFDEGANFKLKIRNFEGYRNYDKSEFAPQSKLFEDDGAMEQVWNKQYRLEDFLEPSIFKSEAEILEKFNRIVNSEEESKAKVIQSPKTERFNKSSNNDIPFASNNTIIDNDEDDLALFRSMIED